MVQLFHAMSHLGEFTTKFNLTDPRKDKNYKDQLEHIDLVYSEAKRTLQVIAASRVLLGPVAGQQSAAAALLKKPGMQLPKALHMELDRLALFSASVAASLGRRELGEEIIKYE